MVVTHQGFVWRAERPEEDTFVGQKWGWTGLQPGDWAELEFDSTDGLSGTRDAAPAGAAGAAAAAAADAGSSEAQQPEEGGNEEAEDGAGEEEAGDPEDEQESERASSSEEDAGIGGMQQADPAALEEEEEGSGGNNTAAAAGRQRGKQQPDAEVLLSHLKSYEGMGVAQVGASFWAAVGGGSRAGCLQELSIGLCLRLRVQPRQGGAAMQHLIAGPPLSTFRRCAACLAAAAPPPT